MTMRQVNGPAVGRRGAGAPAGSGRAALVAVMAAGLLAGLAPARAQQAAEAIPEKMPFNIPYGSPITLARAQSAVQAAEAEAEKRGWPVNIAVVDPGANLVAFVRMDGAQIASIAIAQHKARVAAKYRRPTKVFEDLVKKGNAQILSLDDVIASRGGIPLVEDGKLIGAIGCSGATSAQDEVVCTAGAATINK